MNVIITGASKGLGKAIAEKFAEAGNSLFVCSRNEVQLFKMMEELLTKYPQSTIKAKPVDLSVREEIKSFGTWCLESGVPDIVVNNAGHFFPGSVYNEEEGVLEKMMEAKAGHIFNMCSIASIQAYTNGGAYSISKFALLGFSKNLREEMKPYNIKVTAVIPGAVYTDSWSSSGIDPKRFMEAKDVAEIIYAASQLSPQACVEEILLRPQLGDI